MFIDFINSVIENVLGLDFTLFSIDDIFERIISYGDWHLILFDFHVISSLVVYFALFYFIFYVLMVLPFRLFKTLIHQK